jgi:GH25 family lysozyme M1 (1,4-beta-N-acetylmuramidase)
LKVASAFDLYFPDASNRWTVHGIDVSGNQPASIVRDLKAKHEFESVSVKITEGRSFFSTESVQQTLDTLDLGMSLSLYHWISYRSTAAAEAANVLDGIRRVGMPPITAESPVPLWLDAEDTSYGFHVVSGMGYDSFTLELADRIQQVWQVPIGVYTASWWANGRLGAHSGSRFPLWVADYSDGRVWHGVPEPVMPQAWATQKAMGWQYTSTSAFGHLDLDVFDPTVPIPGFAPHQGNSTRPPIGVGHGPVPFNDVRDDLMYLNQDVRGNLWLFHDDKHFSLIPPGDWETEINPMLIRWAKGGLIRTNVGGGPWIGMVTDDMFTDPTLKLVDITS